MAKKHQKEDVKDEVAELPAFLQKSPTLANIEKINSSLDNDNILEDKQSLNLTVNEKLIFDFEKLLNSFKGKTEAFFTYPSKVQLFETGCFFIRELFLEKGIYMEAPDRFVSFVGRKGKRPKAEDHFVRKGNPKTMYLTVEKQCYDAYYNIIFSFLKEKNDIGNEYYSASFFFYDFFKILDDNFEKLCKYEIENPRD